MKSIVLTAFAVMLLALGCGKSGDDDSGARKSSKGKSADDFLDADATAEERRFLLAGKPFVVAIANRKYDEAYLLLSSHARARMSLNQFAPHEDERQFETREKNPEVNVTPAEFARLLKLAEAKYGAPHKPASLHVESTDPDVLNRRGKDNLSALDSMLAIGAMPDSIPANIRRASLRGQIETKLSREALEKIAKEEETTVEELLKNPDFSTYFTIKIVLVEEGGELKVGYFEFLPPSMLD